MRLISLGLPLPFLIACAAMPATTAPAPTPAAETEIAMPAPVIPMTSAPLDRDAALTRIALGSCLKQQDDQSIWDAVAAANPDLFIFLGDNVYGDVWSRDANLPELRTAYRDLAKSEPFARFRQSTPLMVTWDDHDYGLNDAGGSYPFKYGTEAVFEEAWALPADDPRRMRDGIYHSEIVGPPGQQVQILLLDTRFFRSDLKKTDERNAPGKERYLPDPDPTKTILGDAQYAWLQEQLKKPADLRLVVSSIQVIAEGHGWEAWRTLPTDRQRFYDVIKSSGANGVVFISGDRHAAGLYKTDDAAAYPVHELTSSSLNAPASVWRAQSGETRVEDGPYRLGTMEFDVNYGVVDIDWDDRTVRLGIEGETGNTLQEVTLNIDDLSAR